MQIAAPAMAMTFMVSTAPASAVCPNEQLRAENGSDRLPDCRAYEMVSPPDKNDGGVYPLHQGSGAPLQSATDGGMVVFVSPTAFADPQSSPYGITYLSSRGSEGWSTEAITPPRSPASGLRLDLSDEVGYEGFSPDLSVGFLDQGEPSLAAGAPPRYQTPYLRDNGDGVYQPLITAPPPNREPLGSNNEFRARFAGASVDFSHVVFEANDSLTSHALDPGVGGFNSYEWSSGQLRLVNILPDGKTDPRSGLGDDTIGASNLGHAVSDDGSRVFWAGRETGGLYVRENGTTTVEVDASQRVPAVGGGNGEFMTASNDGSKVFFTDAYALTTGTPYDPSLSAPKLYEYNVETGRLTDLTPFANAQVQGVLGASEDGTSIYFVAYDAEIADGAAQGEPNLFLWREGTTKFIATLSSEDSNDWNARLIKRTARVTPDGGHVAFLSERSLTGYDNADASTGNPDTEVFLYDAGSGRLSCASCNPSGARPIGPSSVPTWTTNVYQSRYLSEDGSRLFFDSADALAPRDTNGEPDVYEYDNGHVHLISSGTSGDGSAFADASANGDDVFFTTSDQLTPQDRDSNIDLYDARVDGGFPAPSITLPCGGESCKPPPSPAPAIQPLASASFSGPGNLVSSVGRPMAKPRKKQVGKTKPRKHRARQKRRARRGAKGGRRANARGKG